MAKAVSDAVLDASLNTLKNNSNVMILCSAQPTTYAEATATYALADVAIGTGDYTGPANGDTSGRKITVNAQTGVDVDTTGTGTHVALVNSGSMTLDYVTTCTSVAVDSAGTVDFGAWDIEIADPS